MKRKIDRLRILQMAKNMSPSPRDSKITMFGAASLVLYLVAAYCAWQIGGWWGVGLIACLFLISTLDEFVHEGHRQELVEMHGQLVSRIAENSEILDDIIPKRGNNNFDTNSP